MYHTDTMDGLDKLTILVVDDDEVSSRITAAFLTKTGAEAECFADAASAIASLERKTYSLIISDWFMPDINGEQFLRRCRQIVPDIPVLFLTANTDIANAIDMMHSGASDYLTKPVSSQELIFKIRRTLERRQNDAMLHQIRRENELLELENQQLVHWRQMYAHKESDQVRQIITLLARTINQSGGFMWLDLLKDSAIPGQNGMTIPAEIYQLIIDSASQQRHILELLGFVNEMQHMEIQLQPIPAQDFITKVLPDMLTECISQSHTHNRRLNYYPGNGPTDASASVDPDLFRQIIWELVVNAIKYSPHQAAITVETYSEVRGGTPALVIFVRNPVCRPEIADNSGKVGIPYELSEQIFNLFYTINAYPAQLPGERWTDGTGLYIVRRLLQKMGAWIEVNNGLDYLSTPPEPFVQFSIILPLEKER